MREQLLAGGTAVPQPESGGLPWLLAGVCAAAAITAAVWYVSRGGAHAAAPGPVPVVPAGGVAGAVAAARTADVEPPVAPTVDPRPHQRAEAIGALDHALASDKLWAQLTEVGDAIVIRSGFCADPGVAKRVDAAHDQLAALGFHAVRCLEKSGAPVWNRDLP
jgi:hypothetical protein